MTRFRARHGLPIALSFAALIALSGYNCGDVLEDPGFDLWCGDTLCAWTLESGAIDRVDTWHASDFGVSMVGPDVAISQSVTGGGVECLRFEMIADIEDTAEVTLQLDIYGDGTVDHEQRIPTSDWQQLSYLIRMPLWYEDMVVRLHKRGSGRAVLAEIAALRRNADECGDLPMIPNIDGGLCERDDACISGVCSSTLWGGTCGACAGDDDCDTGQVCGLATSAPRQVFLYRTCIQKSTRNMGERCYGDVECQTGICNEHVCSTCRDGGDCADGARCTERADAEGREWRLPPWQCDPGAGGAPTGDPCLSDSDCQTGACAGTRPLRGCLSDSRACTDDADCRGFLFDDSGAGEVCVTVGLADGVCQ